MGVDDPFGQAGGPGGEQEFCDRVGADRRGSLLHCRTGRAPCQLPEGGDAVDIGPVAGRDQLFIGHVQSSQRLGEGCGVSDIEQAGPEQASDVPELGVVLALQRIGDRYRGDRNSGGMAGEREQRVIDSIAGKDHHRPCRREAALQQAPGERIDERSCRLVCQLAPGSLGIPLGQEQAGRIAFDRRPEQLRKTGIVRRNRFGRAIKQAAVGRSFTDDPGRPVGNRAKRCRCGHLAHPAHPSNLCRFLEEAWRVGTRSARRRLDAS